MAGIKISALPAAGALTGPEEVPLVQGGVTKRATAQAIANLAPVLPATVLSVSVTLASAQILALKTVPVSVLPAPGAGKVIMPVSVFYSYTYGTITYIHGAAGSLYYGNNAGNSIDNGDATVIGQAVSAISYAIPLNVLFPVALAENMAVVYAISAFANNWINGDGTIKLTFLYTIQTV